MSKSINAGKRPLSQRTRAATINPDEVFMNTLGLDPDMVKTLEAKHLAYRFINYKKFVDMGGVNEGYWVPVSRKNLKEWGYDKIGTQDFIFGSDTDGYIRRGDLVLAVRSQDLNEKHKAYLKQEANARSGRKMQKTHAEELRDLVKSSGLGGNVHEGYEDEEETE